MSVIARRSGLALLALLVCAASPAAAERLVVSLSTHRVLVASNFIGTELVLFGTVERDAAAPAGRADYDIVATVTGPRKTVVIRRKARVLGIWVNRRSRAFVDVPSYLATLATRPLAAITSDEALRRLRLGLADAGLPRRTGAVTRAAAPDDPFRAALVRLEMERGLYVEGLNAVTFLAPTLFRAAIPLPAEVPIGLYEVDVKLFAAGAMIARASSAFEIVKVGFAQFVVAAARDYGVPYGLATAAMALMTGWLASLLLRRD